MAFYLTSPAFAEGLSIPARHCCSGEDLSPELHWSDPEGAVKSFALIMDDLDAPGGTWVHWVLWGIPGETRHLLEGLPREMTLHGGMHQGLAGGVDSFDQLGYQGPCPPKGTSHRYYFRLYALDKALDLAPRSNVFQLRKAMHGHILEETELTGKFER